MEMGFACKAGLFVMSVCVTLLILQQISSSLTSHQRNDMSPQWPAQHSTAQHSTAQHSTAQHSTAQHTPIGGGSLTTDLHQSYLTSGRTPFGAKVSQH